ncbi:MAG: hypothetical protein ACXVJD_00525 [Mucilaginibacter sp.]
MHKALLKLILTFFLFSVIDPGAYSAGVLHGNQPDQYQAAVKTDAHALSLVKIVHQTGSFTFYTYGSEKPVWAGNFDMSGHKFTLACRTLFLQKNRNATCQQQSLQTLLFPFHFFW